MDLAAQARLIRKQISLRRGRAPFSAALAAQVRAHVEARRHAGHTMEDISKDLGIALDTLYRWRREAAASPKLRPVQVVAPPKLSFTLHGPGGLRLEGLTLEQAAQFWRLLA